MLRATTSRAPRAYLTCGLLMAGIVASTAGGCSTRCRGPGCEDDFQSMSVTRISGATLLAGEIDLETATDGQILGGTDEGTGWSVAVVEGDLLIGQPAARAVVRVAAPVDEAELVVPQTTWSVDTPGFGQQVLTMATDAGFDLWVSSADHDEARGGVWRFRDAHAADVAGGEPDLLVTPSSPADRLGTHLHHCGDLTGDGVDDLAVWIPWFQPPDDWSVADPELVPAVAGAVAVLESEQLATATGEVRPWDVGPIYWGASTGASAGAGVHCTDDLDGDGLDDLLIGAPHEGNQAGQVYVVTQPLPASGLVTEVSWGTITSPLSGSWFGEALHAFEWSGATTLVIGAPGAREGRGSAYLYVAAGLDADPTPLAAYDNPRTTPDHLGRSLATADLDGDGEVELILGAPDYREDSRTYGVGRLWVFRADQELGAPIAEAAGTLTDTQPFRRIGQQIVPADLDGDGTDELLLPVQLP